MEHDLLETIHELWRMIVGKESIACFDRSLSDKGRSSLRPFDRIDRNRSGYGADCLDCIFSDTRRLAC